MPVDTFSLADLATFEKDFKPATPAKPTAGTQPAGETPAGAQDGTQIAADSVTLENQPVDSSAAVPGSDGNVDDSSVADSTTANASDDSDSANLTGEATDQQAVKPKGRAQVRIEDLVASNKALKASLDYLQNQVLAKLPHPQASQPTAQTLVATPAAIEEAPTLESCEFDTGKWTKAMHAWTAKQIEHGVTRAVQTVQQNQTAETRKVAFETRMSALAASTPDLQVVLGNPALPQLHKDAASLVVDSEVGPQILYHLGKNPEKAARIARQTPVQQAAAIGRLEAEIQAAKPSQKTPTPNITRAPNPPTPTSGRGNTPSVDPNKMSSQEWIEWDRKQTEAKQRARRA